MPESLIGRNKIGNHGFTVGRGNVRLCVIGSVFDHTTDFILSHENDEGLWLGGQQERRHLGQILRES